MGNPSLNLLAMALYLFVGMLLARGLRYGQAAGGARLGIFALAVGAVILHATLLYSGLLSRGALDLGLTNAISLVAWVVAILFLAAALTKPIESLGVFIMPAAAATLLVEWLWPSKHVFIHNDSPFQAAHIVISLLAYSLLCIAMVQSLMLRWQEQHLRSHQPGLLLRTLPPLETMESLLFQMISLGFLLLTLTLISGLFFSEELFGKPLRFTHHTILAIIAWGVFGILLLGRWRLGWRGLTATRWTLAGFILLALAYFGSKFVLEVVLKR